MRLVVTVLQSLRGHMGVNLRGRQAAVAQKLLHAADIGAAIEQVRREAVPQCVRTGARVKPRMTGEKLGARRTRIILMARFAALAHRAFFFQNSASRPSGPAPAKIK